MKITKEMLLAATKKAVQNAGQLVEEAKILRENKRFARAYTLYQLSIEEVGKASMTFGFALFGNIGDSNEQKVFLKDFRDHKTKTEKATGIDFLIAMSIDNKDVAKALVTNMLKQREELSKINDRKNYSLYTSFIGDSIYLPSEVISPKSVSTHC